MRPIHSLWACCLPLLLPAGLPAETAKGTLEMTVVDKTSRKQTPCRMHLKDAGGKAQRADRLPVWFDHFVCTGNVKLELVPGKYTFEVERGPEFFRVSGTVTIKEKETASLNLELERLIDLSAEGWWPGDLHV